MKKYILSLILLGALCTLSSCSDDEGKDMEPPAICDYPDTDCPTSCDVFHRGDVIPVRMVFTDNVELASFVIDIHNNFNHHTHGTTAVECPLNPKMSDEEIRELEKAKAVWIFTQDYVIPEGHQTYATSVDITIPEDIYPGDYHFMVRVRDKAKWEQLKSVSIKIVK
ncbi:MAG: DUF4625 domain-containing protein [Bacteroidaceae bacterium]|nr:DUF4625 domain-containing protein [Bacteroidaceae bacterium]